MDELSMAEWAEYVTNDIGPLGDVTGVHVCACTDHTSAPVIVVTNVDAHSQVDCLFCILNQELGVNGWVYAEKRTTTVPGRDTAD